jgi:hypothetical protein
MKDSTLNSITAPILRHVRWNVERYRTGPPVAPQQPMLANKLTVEYSVEKNKYMPEYLSSDPIA